MYTQGLTLLSNVFTAGISHPTTATAPACVPSPKYLQIASTLLVHPLFTNRASNKERLEIGSRSITLLRNVLQDVGPRAAHLEQAFAFRTSTNKTGRNTRRGWIAVESHDGESNSDEETHGDGIKGAVSQQGVFRRAKDFWHIVGWAFNCSVRYPKRWRYWKILLEYLLDVLDNDWTEREAIDEEENQAKREAEHQEKRRAKHQASVELDLEGDERLRENKVLHDSLLIRYLGGFDYNYSSAPLRRIVKAAFADGSAQSLKDFPEIFENETNEIRNETTHKRKRDEKMDVTGEMEFGDYEEENDDGDDLFEPSDGSPSPGLKAKTMGASTYTSTMGDSDAIILRQKVMTLPSTTSQVPSPGRSPKRMQ
ncbi:major facilitator superfamily transporter protein [Rutstroemia sp. NJR-2017a BVV2]|nr:major facilitator superfamily transporter protein [Rutstroemia sp. NJR-2017a BVV2]